MVQASTTQRLDQNKGLPIGRTSGGESLVSYNKVRKGLFKARTKRILTKRTFVGEIFFLGHLMFSLAEVRGYFLVSRMLYVLFYQDERRETIIINSWHSRMMYQLSRSQRH